MLSMVSLAFRFAEVRREIDFLLATALLVDVFFAADFLFCGEDRFLAARRRVLVFINSDSAGKDARSVVHRLAKSTRWPRKAHANRDSGPGQEAFAVVPV